MGVAPTPALPKGGGAIRDIGEKFSANAATGTASLQVPIATSPGRSGFQPDLALAYDSGAGTGVFGAGWHLSVPHITRKTDRGLPQYRDRHDSDVYILSGMEDLVPILGPDGTPDVFEEGDEIVERYRPRIEGPFARIERREQPDANVYWKATTHDNVTSFYGRTPASQIVDPVWPRRIFTWLLDETRDDRGNVIVYEYKPEDLAGVPNVVSEGHRLKGITSFSNRHLKRIRYGNTVPGDATTTVFEVVFDHGEHDPATPTPDEAQPWPARQDPTSTYRPGFEVRTYRLCRRILMFHHFTELGPTPCLVASTDLGYDENPVLTKLASVTHTGYQRDAGGTTYSRASLPALEFGYSPAELHTDVRSFDASSLTGIPAGIDHRAQWVDLDGEGLPGVLISDEGSLFYKRNVGDGVLARPRTLPVQPRGANLADPRQQIVDLDGDGRKELAFWSFPKSGYHERTDDDGWGRWHPFDLQPMFDSRNPAVHYVDVTGDGRQDILLVDDASITLFPSLGRGGYGYPRRMARGGDEQGWPPRCFMTDTVQAIMFADMTGDGLPDLVRIKNGQVCYWPNLGFGKFGTKITMEFRGAFDASDRFEPRRIRLGDIDGSGTTDILYVRRDGIDFHANQAGNSLAAPVTLPRFPSSDEASTIAVVDVFGSGTPCLVWSSPHARHTADPMRYMDLHQGKKPHLLTLVNNHMGRTTALEYTSSTRFYLADLKAGEPWATKLPFPVQVLTRVETYDAVSKVRLVTTYAYHHGHYDGVEREFRGFGRVEQRDAESFSAAVGQGELPPADRPPAGAELMVPPVLTKTWFHTGYSPRGASLAALFAGEYFQNGSVLPLTVFTEQVLKNGVLVEQPVSLLGTDAREAARALKGQILRQEVYAEDGSVLAAVPYAVSERSYAVRLLQRSTGTFGPVADRRVAVEQRGATHACFLVHPRETIDLHHERNAADPRVTHAFVLQVDPYGAVLQSAAVAYPRRIPVEPEQAALAITVAEASVFNAPGQPAWYRLGVPLEERSYELTGLAAPAGGGTFAFDEVATAAANAAGIPHEATPDGSLQKRLLKEIRHLYWSEDLSAPLDFGAVASRALPYQSYAKAFTPARLAGAFGARVTVTPAMLTEGGYIQLAGDDAWWVPSGRQAFSPADFYLPITFIDPFGNATNVTYDPAYHLFVDQVADTLGNVVAASYDLRVLAPSLLTDPNGNRAAAGFDDLGRVVATAVMGKDATEGDTLDDPTTTFQYAFYNAKTGQPNVVHMRAREQHGAANTRWQESYSYSDGSGHEVMKKVQAEPGDAYAVDAEGQIAIVTASPRWVGTGRTVFDNKGNPVKKYEPYFSATFAYEDDEPLVTWGVTPILHYDPLGRLVRTDLPNGTFSKVVFDAWQATRSDPNDTVVESLWYQDRQAPGTPASEQLAATNAAAHANTPSVVHLDPLGRAFLTVEDNGTVGKYPTRVALDVEGNPLAITDARGVQAQTSVFAMGGQKVHEKSCDAGEHWALADVAGGLLRAWDGPDVAWRAKYDELRRVTHLFAQQGADDEILAERTVYGEKVQSAAALNLRGKLYQSYDGAGAVTNVRFDFNGNLLESRRRLAKRYDVQVDWKAIRDLADPGEIANAAEGLLEPEVFPVQTAYDALHRPTSLITPDTSEIRPTYNEASLLERVDVRIRGAAAWTAFVDSIEYNAKGQRETIVYGTPPPGMPQAAGSVTTAYTYDDYTFRLKQLKSTRVSDGAVLQNLRYTYDPVGNITEIADSAQQKVFFANDVVLPAMAYVYDALYRLSSATGREQAGGLADVQRDVNDLPVVNLPDPNDQNAVRNYAESYVYDAVGNISQMSHQVPTSPLNVGTWTRQYVYETDASNAPISNRLVRTSVGPSGPAQAWAKYVYDARGNMTSMPHLPTIGWNFKGEMVSADRDGGGMVYFTYNAAGQRVRKVWVHSGLVEERIYLGGYEVYRKRAVGAGAADLERQTLHVTDGAQRIALVETTTVDASAAGAPRPSTVTRFQLGNHLGSAMLEVDEGGLVISYEDYHPYGTTAYHSGTGAAQVSLKRYRYTGKERDEETGLYYHGARYYAPWLGRWTSADPAGLVDGLGLFTYVRGNPIALRDPSGHEGVNLFTPIDPTAQMSMGAATPTLGQAKFKSASQRLAAPPALSLKPMQKPLSSSEATTPPEPPTPAEKEAGVSDPELHAQSVPVTVEPNSSNLGADPVRYINHHDVDAGPGPDLSPERMRHVFAANDVQKAEDYVASLPPTSADKVTDAIVELSPLGSAKDIAEGVKEGSAGKVILGAATIFPVAKLAKGGKLLRIARAAKIGAKEERAAERIIRFTSLGEAEASAEARGLALRPGHRGPKRVAEAGADIKIKNLGNAKSYSHQIELKVREGTTEWLRSQRAWHIAGEPGRYAIPAERLNEFNDRILEIFITRVR
jgi:RHS repeat-associated protein